MNIITITNKDDINIYIDDDLGKTVIINGEYKNIDVGEGFRIIKKLIPTGNFQIKISFPSL